MSPRVGVTLSGRYRLQRLIATGGMGQVWEAVDSRLGRRVAVAVLVENGGDRLAATGGALAAPIGRATMAAALQGAP